ncbi:MAG: hypothetical protein ACJAS1_002898 [Oleiphilaceae bacterium]|jgi:hypothetical protein
MDIQFNQSIIKYCSELFVALGRFINKSVTEVFHKLFAVLRQPLKQSVKGAVLQITFNYRDSSYHRELGGYNPVVLSQPEDTFNGTEFNSYGDSYAGRARELDFDFNSGTSFVPCSQLSLIIARIKAIFNLWLYDFLTYLKYGVCYQIKLSAW